MEANIRTAARMVCALLLASLSTLCTKLTLGDASGREPRLRTPDNLANNTLRGETCQCFGNLFDIDGFECGYVDLAC